MIHILRRFAAVAAAVIVAWSCVAWQRYAEEAIESIDNVLVVEEGDDEIGLLQVQVTSDQIHKVRRDVTEEDDFESLLQVGDVPMLAKHAHRQSPGGPTADRSGVIAKISHSETSNDVKHDGAPTDDDASLLQVKVEEGPMLMQQDDRKSGRRQNAASQEESPALADQTEVQAGVQSSEADVITRWEEERKSNISGTELAMVNSTAIAAGQPTAAPLLEVLDLLTDPAITAAPSASASKDVATQAAITEEVWRGWEEKARAFHTAGIQAIDRATGANVSKVESIVANVSQDLISTDSSGAEARHERMEKLRFALGWFSVGVLSILLLGAVFISAKKKGCGCDKRDQVKAPLSVRALCHEAC